MKKFNVYSAKVKKIDNLGKVLSTQSIVYKKTVPRKTMSGGSKNVCDPQIIMKRDSISLGAHFKKEFKLKKSDIYILQVKTTKGQFYFASL